MTVDTSYGYKRFLELLRWVDETWTNQVQPSQAWWQKIIGVSIRTIRRYWAQARLDSIWKTLKRYRRTSIQILIGGRHDKQMQLPLEQPLEDLPTKPCPDSVPTVSVHTRVSKTEYVSTVVEGAFEKLREAFCKTKRVADPEEESRIDPWILRQRRAEREREAIAKLSPEVRARLGLHAV